MQPPRTFAGPSAGEGAILALFFVSGALQWGGGVLTRFALAGITVALLCTIWSLLAPEGRVRWLLPCAVLLYEIEETLTTLPPAPHGAEPIFFAAIWLSAAAGLAACVLPHLRWKRLAAVVAVAGVFVAGSLLIHGSPRPAIDVWDLHQEGSKALFHGENPYGIRIRDIYTPEYSRKFYGPGMSLGGRLTVGFPYPPISLFISSLGYLAAGEIRYAHLAAICIAALLLAFARPSRAGVLGALLFLFAPSLFLVLLTAWSEPTVVFLLALTVFCRCRFPKAAPWVTGLLLTGKQYVIFAAPALLRKWSELPKAAIAAALVTAPLVLWNVREFFNSAVFFHFSQPTRPDALSYMALFNKYGIHLPGWVPFLLTAAAMAFVLRRAPATTTAIFSATALLLIVFFAFNKSAFTNYYYLVIAALAGAIATIDPIAADDPAPRS